MTSLTEEWTGLTVVCGKLARLTRRDWVVLTVPVRRTTISPVGHSDRIRLLVYLWVCWYLFSCHKARTERSFCLWYCWASSWGFSIASRVQLKRCGFHVCFHNKVCFNEAIENIFLSCRHESVNVKIELGQTMHSWSQINFWPFVSHQHKLQG